MKIFLQLFYVHNNSRAVRYYVNIGLLTLLFSVNYLINLEFIVYGKSFCYITNDKYLKL